MLNRFHCFCDGWKFIKQNIALYLLAITRAFQQGSDLMAKPTSASRLSSLLRLYRLRHRESLNTTISGQDRYYPKTQV